MRALAAPPRGFGNGRVCRPDGASTSLPALYAGHRERRADPNSALPLPGERARRSGPPPAAAHEHRLHPQRDHPPASLPLRHWPVQLQAPARHRQQQAEPAAVLRGGV